MDRAERITKQTVISEIAKIFDPLGILGPIILHAKKLIQDLWRSKIDWDESVPSSTHTAWIDFATQLDSINELSIDRPVVISDYIDIQIHGFCDASQNDYGA